MKYIFNESLIFRVFYFIFQSTFFQNKYSQVHSSILTYNAVVSGHQKHFVIYFGWLKLTRKEDSCHLLHKI